MTCEASEERCKYASCQYGTQRYYDDRTQCEECYCNEPCHGFECPYGTSCQVGLIILGSSSTAGQETIYKAFCKDDTKAEDSVDLVVEDLQVRAHSC